MLGKEGTFVMTTSIKNHGSEWKLFRVRGDLDHRRFIIIATCDHYKSEYYPMQTDWVMSAGSDGLTGDF